MEQSLLLSLLCVWALCSLSTALEEAMEQCPERILGNERRRACPKKCQHDKECGSKRQCLCDGQCGGRTCPWPLPSAKNFDVALLSPTSSFSALHEVHCKPGYAMPYELDATIRRCQGDRQWSGDEPVCTASPGLTAEPILVPEVPRSLPEDDDPLSVQGSTFVGSTTQYKCAPGYVLVGHSENFCHENQKWQYPHPKCRPRCPIPAQRSRVIVGGAKRWPYDLMDSVVAHGQNVTFFCKHPDKLCSFTATDVCVDGQLRHLVATLTPPGCSSSSFLIGWFLRLMHVTLLTISELVKFH